MSSMIGFGSDHKKIETDGSGQRLARWLGVAHRVGSDLCYWLLLESGNVIARTTVQHVVWDNILNDDVKRQIEQFDSAVEDAEMSTFYIEDKLNLVKYSLISYSIIQYDVTTVVNFVYQYCELMVLLVLGSILSNCTCIPVHHKLVNPINPNN